MGSAPKRIDENAMAVDAMELMEENGISRNCLWKKMVSMLGVVHLHDLIKEGII